MFKKERRPAQSKAIANESIPSGRSRDNKPANAERHDFV